MGILQARILEWAAMLCSMGSSQTRDWTQVSRTAGRFFTIWATREASASLYSKCIVGWFSLYFPLFGWNYVYFGDYLGKIISISDIVTVPLITFLCVWAHFCSKISVTSEHFKSGILMFYVFYYSYDFSFLYLSSPVLIFRIYRVLTWHVCLIYLVNFLFNFLFIMHIYIYL